MKFHLTSMFLLAVLLPIASDAQGVVPNVLTERKISQKLTTALDRAEKATTGSVDRATALAIFLRAQRQLWSAARKASMLENIEARNAAKLTLIAALEKDPMLSEAYTMLAELELTSQGQNVAEALAFTELAIRANPANFGSRRLRARILTRTSGLTQLTVDRNLADQAIAAWSEVVKLDPLNAEAWAFLSKLYESTRAGDLQLEALRKWTSSPAPVDSGFFRAVMGREADLSPEYASTQLATFLISTKRSEEAVDILTNILIDDPENRKALDLIAKAVDAEPVASLPKIAGKLRSALSSNPGNPALVLLVKKIDAQKM